MNLKQGITLVLQLASSGVIHLMIFRFFQFLLVIYRYYYLGDIKLLNLVPEIQLNDLIFCSSILKNLMLILVIVIFLAFFFPISKNLKKMVIKNKNVSKKEIELEDLERYFKQSSSYFGFLQQQKRYTITESNKLTNEIMKSLCKCNITE